MRLIAEGGEGFRIGLGIAGVAGEESVGETFGEAVAAAAELDEGVEARAVGAVGEVHVAEALEVLDLQVGEVVADELEVGWARAGFKEEGHGGKERGAVLGGECGHAVDFGGTVRDAGEQRGVEDADAEAGVAQALDGAEAQVGAGCAGLELAGEVCVRRRDGDVDDEGAASVNLLKEVDVALDEGGLGDDAEAEVFAFRHDFEQAAGEFGAALDGLPGIGGGTEGDFFVEPVLAGEFAEVLLEEPGGVFLDEDLFFEGFGGAEAGGFTRGFEEFVSVAGVAVAAGELAAAIGIDGPGGPAEAFGDGVVEDGAAGEGAELDVVADVELLAIGGGTAEGGAALVPDDGEECRSVRLFFAHVVERSGCGRWGQVREGRQGEEIRRWYVGCSTLRGSAAATARIHP